MIYTVEWTDLAKETYFAEIDFIYQKWNSKEVVKFEYLVEIEINRISKNPLIGKLEFGNCYVLIISKQTTLFYRIKNEIQSIELILFWNNLKNPDELINLL